MLAVALAMPMMRQRPLAGFVLQAFASGEPGAWYDPSDMSTLFQDSAGTTPVTAVEQPVGLMLDKSGRGNHAIQATTTKRPIYSRRVNLLTKTDSFTDLWAAYGCDATLAQTGPTGAANAVLVMRSTTASFQTFYYFLGVQVAVGSVCTLRAVVKPAGNSLVELHDSFDLTFRVVFDLSTATVVYVGGAGTSGAIQARGDGWFDISATTTWANSSVRVGFCETDSVNNPFAPGSGAGGVLVAEPSITLATDAHIPYQRVNTATDYDADPAKFPAYLRFDGVDDALQTGNIDFTSTDKMTVWAGVTKLAPSGFGMLYELGNVDATNGSVCLVDPYGPAGTGYAARGTVVAVRSVPISAPATYIATSVVNLSGATRASSIAARRDGVSYPSASGDGDTLGGGAFGNHVFSIGARGGINTYFNGRLYSLIVRGTQTPLSQIEATELYIKQKMRMP